MIQPVNNMSKIFEILKRYLITLRTTRISFTACKARNKHNNATKCVGKLMFWSPSCKVCIDLLVIYFLFHKM